MRTGIRIEAVNSYHTSRDQVADLRVDSQNNLLIVKGFRFDMVNGLGIGFENNKTLITSNIKLTPTKGNSIAYANDEETKGALCRTIIVDKGQSEEFLSTLDGFLNIPWTFTSSELINSNNNNITHLQIFTNCD